MNATSYLMWQEPKADAAHRIAAALAAARRLGAEPRLALVAPGEGAAVPGVEVREPKAGEGVVAKGVCWVRGGHDAR